MSHRAKHRLSALKRRVKAGRRIKSDETPEGRMAYERERLKMPNEDKAKAWMRDRLKATG